MSTIPHDHEQCRDLLLSLRPSQRMCSIPDDGSHGQAVHAMPSLIARITGDKRLSNGIRTYCEDCFVDIFGPHICERLGCHNPPCRDSGKWPTEEVTETEEECGEERE